MTAPGGGMIVALTYKVDLGDPTRFKKSDSVGAYYGMTPRQYSSGENIKQGRISRCGAREVRTLLAGSSSCVVNSQSVMESFKGMWSQTYEEIWFKKSSYGCWAQTIDYYASDAPYGGIV